MGKTQIDSTKTQCKIFPKLSFSEIACNQWNQKSGEKKGLHARYLVALLEKSHQSSLILPPCKSMKIRVIKDEYKKYGDSNNLTIVRIIPKPAVWVHTLVWEYPDTSFFAEIGGYLGMLLGMSIFNIVSMASRHLSKLLHSRLLRCRRETSPNKQINSRREHIHDI